MAYDLKLCQALGKAARDFMKLRLWQEFNQDDGVVLELEGVEEPLYVLVMGQSGQEFGLVLHRGPEALAQIRALLQGQLDDDLKDEIDELAICLSPYSDISPEHRGFLAKTGTVRNRRGGVPVFFVKKPGAVVRLPTPEEVRLLLMAVNALNKASQRRGFSPASYLGGAPLPRLLVTGDPRAPTVISARDEPTPAAPSEPERSRAAPARKNAELQDTLWLVALPTLPSTIRGDARTVRGFMVFDARTDKLLALEPLMSDQTDEAPARLEALVARLGAPAAMSFSSRKLFDAAAPGLEARGVTCDFEPDRPEIAALLDLMARTFEDDELLDEDEDDEDEGVFERVHEALGRHLVEEKLATGGLLKRYFGAERDAHDLLRGPQQAGAAMTFRNWLAEYPRAGEGKGSLLERLRADFFKGDAEALALIDSRLAAVPTLLRVTANPSPRSVMVLDLFTGEESRINDAELALVWEVGLVIPGKVYAEGARLRFLPLGPGLQAVDLVAALRFLEAKGLDFRAGGRRVRSYLFGRLWAWLKERDQEAPKLANIDGDAIALRELRFKLEDRAAFEERLRACEDIAASPDGDGYGWMKPGDGPLPMPGKLVVAARIRFKGQNLTAEVNSERRAKALKSKLEVLGARQVGSRSKPLPPELYGVEGALVDLTVKDPDVIRHEALAWLDRPQAWLDGESPRAAAASEERRPMVAAVIRAAPTPDGLKGPVPVSGLLLAELGLAGAKGA